MSKHTEGPWQITDDQVVVYALGDDGCNVFLAHVQGGRKTPENELKANANLIAAAPEMLEALEVSRNVLAKQLRFSAPERFETEAQVREHVVIKQMDQAIEKARGEK